MYLNDINNSFEQKIEKVNKFLSSNYGFKLPTDMTFESITTLRESTNTELSHLSAEVATPSIVEEISKRLMILEGLEAIEQLNTIPYVSPKFAEVVGHLSDFVVHCVSIGDDINDAITSAMKEYRSSMYRFDDADVQNAVHDEVMHRLGTTPIEEHDDLMMMGDESWSTVGKRSSAHGGHTHGTLDQYQRARLGRIGGHDTSLELEPTDNETELPLIHLKNGDVVVDPFELNAIELRKGRMMKENKLAKRLRSVYESRVSQAEVMISAKSFAEELQEMVEKIGRLQNEDLPPVVDRMRETYNHTSSSSFQTEIYSALQNVMDTLYTAKTQIDDAVSDLATTGTYLPRNSMDAPVDDMGDMGDTGEDEFASVEDEFTGAEEEAPLGREMKTEGDREEELRTKIEEMRKLVNKAQKLKEKSK